MGNGGQWMNAPGYQTAHIPTEHSALSFSPGQAGADPTYGHVAFVEQVKSDGSILISESNVKGLGVISYRTLMQKQQNNLLMLLENRKELFMLKLKYVPVKTAKLNGVIS